MRYHSQWDDSHIGLDPVGWTRAWAATGAGSPTTHLFAPRYGSPPTKRRYLATSSTLGSFGAIYHNESSWEPERANCDILSCYQRGTETNGLLIGRGSGVAGAEAGYILNAQVSAGVLELARLNAGAGTILVNTAYAFTLGDWYYLRLRIQGRGATVVVSATVWPVGDVEPTTPNLTFNDTSGSRITAGGFIGLMGFVSGSGSGAWNFFAVATGGDIARIPLTDDLWYEWLDRQDQLKCVISEMSYSAYTPLGPTYVKRQTVYSSNMTYTSHKQDFPSEQEYEPSISKVPTLSQAIGLALKGKTELGFGSVVHSNPRLVDGGPGVRDKWLRRKWNQSTISILVGDPTWPRHDFRPLIVGRVGQPTGRTEITFTITELSSAFNDAVQTDTFVGTGTEVDNTYKPILLGVPYSIDPIKIATRTYRFHDGPTLDFPSYLSGASPEIYDAGASLETASLSVFGVDTATERITTAAAHGILVDYVVIFSSGTPPSPLALNTKYYVITIPTTTSFTLALTRGGSVINLTTSTTGAIFQGFGYDSDGLGQLTLATDPVGRVHMEYAQQAGTRAAYPAVMMSYAVFDQYGLSQDFKDQESFDDLDAMFDTTYWLSGYWVDNQRHTVGEVVGAIADGTNCWYGFTSDGLMEVGRLDLPEDVAELVVKADDMEEGSLEQTSTILPVDFTKADITYRPKFLTAGPALVNGIDVSKVAFEPKYSYGTPGIPVDTPPQGDTQVKGQFDTIFVPSAHFEQIRLANFYEKQLGVFRAKVRLSTAMRVRLGRTIELESARLGWKEYGPEDGASPDNMGAWDATKAVLIGRDIDLSDPSPFKAWITFYRQLPQDAGDTE